MLDLGGVPLFAQLSRVDIARLLPEFDEVALAAGELLFAQGEPGDALYIVREGTLCAELNHSGGTETLEILGPGRVIGEVALLSDQPRTASIRAVTAATLWRLSRQKLDDLDSPLSLVRRLLWPPGEPAPRQRQRASAGHQRLARRPERDLLGRSFGAGASTLARSRARLRPDAGTRRYVAWREQHTAPAGARARRSAAARPA